MTNAEAYKLFCKDMIRAIGGMSIPGIDLNYGLCSNLSTWVTEKEHVPQTVISYQDELFEDDDDPFNYSIDEYYAERDNGTLYKNTARLKWIQEHAE